MYGPLPWVCSKRETVHQAHEQAGQEAAAAEHERQTRQGQADQAEQQAENQRVSDARTAVQLQQEARRSDAGPTPSTKGQASDVADDLQDGPCELPQTRQAAS
jgi:hypothetical protein